MDSEKTLESRALRILVVARWPLGGIRTYMRYTYKYLPRERFNITIFASKTAEEEALGEDAKELGARLIVADPIRGKDRLFLRLFPLLLKDKFDIIQSHGFISAAHVYLANRFFRIPHVLTIHGIIEEKFLGKGFTSILKGKFLERVINNVDVLYGVSRDILDHVETSIKVRKHIKRVVIHNGINVADFVDRPDLESSLFRKNLGVEDSIFVLGFVGRFMPQKGFNYLIDAIEILENRDKNHKMKLLAVGSGDYLGHYKKQINERKLGHRFIFLPFQRDIAQIYDAVDAVAMPSVWEAYGLQAAEALCSGVPIIASDCIGLREAVRDTPAIVIPSKNSTALAEAIHNMMQYPSRNAFQDFKTKAIERYDVRKTSKEVEKLFESLVSQFKRSSPKECNRRIFGNR
jgi:glycosyltransferase involved in cell wall biosynthesis